MWIESCFLSWSGKVKLSLLLQWLNKASNWLINKNKLIINMYVKKFRLVTTGLVPATIPDKTTRESFPIMSTFLRNKTISKMTPLRKENPFPQFNVASYKRPGIRLF